MIKLYLMYLFVGSYLFVESDFIWRFTSDGEHAIAGLAIVASLLCSIAAGLSFFNIKATLVIGIISLIGVFPFGIYWLIFQYQNDYFTTLDVENIFVYAAVIIYFSCLIYTIVALISNKQHNLPIKKWLRLSLSAIALILFGLQVFLFFAK